MSGRKGRESKPCQVDILQSQRHRKAKTIHTKTRGQNYADENKNDHKRGQQTHGVHLLHLTVKF